MTESDGLDWFPVLLSLRIATVVMLALIPTGIPLAWYLSRRKEQPSHRFLRTLLSTAILLPLVLPPTVVGFVLLLLLGRGSNIGHWLNDSLHIRLLFTWQGAAIAAFVMALPLFVRTAQTALETVEEELLEMARTLGATEGQVLRHVVLPMAIRGLLASCLLGWARAFGEFGATLVIAGNIPQETQTLPLALYARVESGDNRQALLYTAITVAFAFFIVAAVEILGRHVARTRREK